MLPRLKQKLLCREQSGFTFLEYALVLPIIVTILIGAAYLTTYFRALYKVGEVASAAANAFSSGEYTDFDGNSHLHWEHIENPDPAKIPKRPYVSLRGEHCRSTNDAKLCVEEALKKAYDGIGNLNAVMWPGFKDESYDRINHLPFRLYQEPIDGYYPVQTLPLVGIKLGCVDPYHEQQYRSTLIKSDKRRYDVSVVANTITTTASSEGGCRHIKPIYWYSPHRADFDGDNKEDLVFFYPQGPAVDYTTVGANAPSEELDFIVYKSGKGYAVPGGIIAFNLTGAPSNPMEPAPIPIVHDYDRDGLSDYAVYEPSTGIFRIAFSITRYRVIGEGRIDSIVDTNGQLGLMAIPGTFEDSRYVEVAVIPTGSQLNQADERYSMHLSGNIEIDIAELRMYESSYKSYPVDFYQINNSSYVKNDFYVKPHRGTTGHPAFADWNDDGEVEVGYMMTYSSNLTKRVAGAVPEPNATDSEIDAFPLVDPDGSQKSPYEYKLNPFDMATDENNNLYVVDSIDGRIVKLTSNGEGRGEFKSARAILPGNSRQRRRDNLTEEDYPLNNVWNIPKEDDNEYEARLINTLGGSESDGYVDGLYTVEYTLREVNAEDRALKTPRRIVLTPKEIGDRTGDHAMYIADWGNHRIVRVDANANNEIFDSSKTYVVLGDSGCPGDSNCQDINFGNESGQSRGNGKFEIYPSAIEIIPIDSRRYGVAFSSGYSVFFIAPASGSTGGPKGDSTDMIYAVAGDSHLAPSVGEAALTFWLHPFRPFPNTWVNFDGNSDALENFICPVLDIEYVQNGPLQGKVLLASNCASKIYPNQPTYPYETSDMYQYSPLRNVGGIISIASNSGQSLIDSISLEISTFLGSYDTKPCNNDFGSQLCITPSAIDDSGYYHRTVDLTNSLPVSDIDLINVSDLKINSEGSGLYFINQWFDNNAPESYRNNVFYNNGPKTTDKQHHQGVHFLDINSSGQPTNIIPVDNPWQRGNNTIPIESAYFRTPHTTSTLNVNKELKAFESPIKHIPFPATSSLNFDNNGNLFTSTPYLMLPKEYSKPFPLDSSMHPYYHKPQKIGFIYRVALDTDGDGVSDTLDTDIDGDGVRNIEETLDSSDRSQSCSEPFSGIISTSTPPCRLQDKIGNPKIYFRKINELGEMLLPKDQDKHTTANYAEYFLFNLLGDCGDSCEENGYKGAGMRSQILANLLNYGDDLFMTNGSINLENSTCINSSFNDDVYDPDFGYTLCKSTSNGPIVSPNAAHIFNGKVVPDDSHIESSPIGSNFLIETSSGDSAIHFPQSYINKNAGLMKYPTIFSSTRPKENGIKPITRPLADKRSSKLSPISSSGIICKGTYTEVIDKINYTSSSVTPHSSNIYFSFNGQDFNTTQLHSSFFPNEEPIINNDNLSYVASCNLNMGSNPLYPPEWTVGTEALLFGLDHDETNAKIDLLNGEDISPESVDYWPHPWVVGPLDAPENLRQFLLIDTDGDGARNPSWFTTETSDLNLINDMGRDGKEHPFTFISTNLRKPYAPEGDLSVAYSVVETLDRIRYPFIDDIMKTASYGLPGFKGAPTVFKYPVYYGYTYSSNFPAVPQYNFSFDLGKSFENDQNDKYNGTIFVGLDAQPYLQRKFDYEEVSDVGSALYANYTHNKRDVDEKDFEDEEHMQAYLKDVPWFNIAKNLLVASFNDISHDDVYYGDVTAPAPEKAWVKLVKDSDEFTSHKVKPKKVRVTYITSFLGSQISVAAEAPIRSSELQYHDKRCDPTSDTLGDCTNALGGSSSP